ncbi:MAG: 1,4-alpha-glucan-branching protein, partial [Bacteroidota bacterium]|nr:1,4-alpha-glucan-branching protein [Bacteroidota bacterium]
MLLCYAAHSQLLNWSPSFITEQSQNATITANAAKGNKGLLNHAAGDVYVHIGAITNYSTGNGDWKHVQSTWATTADSVHAISTATNQWTFTLPGTVRSFFKMTDPNETILKIAILFRSGDGNTKLSNSDGTDMFVPVYATGLQTRITQPYRQPTFTPIPEVQTYKAGDAVSVSAIASSSATLQLFYNGIAVASAAGTSISATPAAVNGNNQIIATATSGSVVKSDTLSFYVNSPVVVQELPTGVRDGINYGNNGTSVTLVLFAPHKTRAAVIGEFNSWTRSTLSEMNRTPDSSRYWITLTGLQAGVEYAYQYVVDDTLKVADMFAEKILDPANDPYIDAETYPSLKLYPAGQTDIVSVLETGKPAYTWQATNFAKPDKRNLVIYELLVRDFVAAHNWQTIKDSLPYLKKLGINAVEVMPFNEFEGNNSWGYNPDFYFAPDKYYGTDVA